MTKRQPPLNTLRTFRAAAHTLSFTTAANELNITQAAVSHQIKSLEESLCQALFVRGNRSLSLSEAGSRFLPYIDQLFTILDQGLEQLNTRDTSKTLTVTTMPSFASRWLVPRIGLFLKAYPDVDLRLSPTRSLTNFQLEQVDIAIRYGSGNYPGNICIHLMNEDIYPVCNPEIITTKKPLTKPQHLKHHNLLHDDGHGDWRKWLVAANVNCVDADKGPVYTDSAMSVQSAIEGDGVALARSQLVRDDLAKGHLIKPFDITQPSSYAYYIVYPEEIPPTSAMKSFITWLHDQTHASELKYQ